MVLMPQHYRLFEETKQQYREILAHARAALQARLLDLGPAESCAECPPSAEFTDRLTARHAGCPDRQWQADALETLEQEIGREILQRLEKIEAYKNTFNCHMCGMCCRLASSEYSYDELQARAEAGDSFAQQFTSIFLPYASTEAAERKYPEVTAAVQSEAGQDVYFYHCPYIGEDNRCTIYGTDKRPEICASYPETPLSFVYEKCAWRPWKDETHGDTLLAHALLTLSEDYAARLRLALS